MARFKVGIARAWAWLVEELKNPALRPIERKVIVWVVRLVLGVVGVKVGVELERVVAEVID